MAAKEVHYAKNYSSLESQYALCLPLRMIMHNRTDWLKVQEKLPTFYTNSHADFKHPKPLWQNPDFFIKLPFKLNEDVNPSKASHSRISPTDLQLANCNLSSS
ncbi:hypothetical protein Ddye_010954 [Dipteronia dyeriana]|uniref:Uncharacterized protein n=1 Tax=Dipteronia dyeriana TaxID=168575 RepID=A0AAD9XEP4_9ROSI|nr:hypothetical protein Ddye_010954 [Dipteronia dyeriana]